MDYCKINDTQMQIDDLASLTDITARFDTKKAATAALKALPTEPTEVLFIHGRRVCGRYADMVATVNSVADDGKSFSFGIEKYVEPEETIPDDIPDEEPEEIHEDAADPFEGYEPEPEPVEEPELAEEEPAEEEPAEEVAE